MSKKFKNKRPKKRVFKPGFTLETTKAGHPLSRPMPYCAAKDCDGAMLMEKGVIWTRCIPAFSLPGLGPGLPGWETYKCHKCGRWHMTWEAGLQSPPTVHTLLIKDYAGKPYNGEGVDELTKAKGESHVSRNSKSA